MIALLANPLIRKYVLPGIAVLTVVGLIYGKGRIDASHAKTVADLKHNIETLQKDIRKEREVRKADAARAAVDQEHIFHLEDEIRKLDENLKDASRVCLDDNDTKQLRNLWETK